MKLKFHLIAYSRKTDELVSKRRLQLGEAIIRTVLGLSPNTDLTGNFPVDLNTARRLRREGADLDLRSAEYFVESEAAYADVMDAINGQQRIGSRLLGATPARAPHLAAPRREVPWVSRQPSTGRFVPSKSVPSGSFVTAKKTTSTQKAASKKAVAKKAAPKKAAKKR
jgi:hypothetical protein